MNHTKSKKSEMKNKNTNYEQALAGVQQNHIIK